MYDSNAFVRAAVQRSMLRLVESRRLPLSRVHAVTALAADRLRDKAAGVRKAAMQLVSVLLVGNPFGGCLDAAPYQAQLQAEEAWLAEHGPKTAEAMEEKVASAAQEAAAAAREAEEEEEGEGEEEGAPAASKAARRKSIAEAAVAEAIAEAETAGEVEVTEEQLKHLRVRDYCVAAVKFVEQMDAAIPVIGQLLGSKVTSDVLEAARFLASAHAFGLRCAEEGLKKMLALVWSREHSVRDEVLKTFVGIYIHVPGTSKRQSPVQVSGARLLTQLSCQTYW